MPKIATDPVPSKDTKAPLPGLTVKVPDPAGKLIVVGKIVLSTSATERPVMDKFESSLVICGTITVLTGASLTGVMSMMILPLSRSLPPLPWLLPVPAVPPPAMFEFWSSGLYEIVMDEGGGGTAVAVRQILHHAVHAGCCGAGVEGKHQRAARLGKATYLNPALNEIAAV